jgi:type I restriction enzyme S subunit
MSDQKRLDEIVGDAPVEPAEVRASLDETSLGEIPKDWYQIRLDAIVNESSYGAAESAEDFNPQDPRYVRITDINSRGRLKPDTKVSLSRKKADGHILSEGDLLFARSGASVGKTYLYRQQDGECAYAGYLIRQVIDTDVANPEFVYQYTDSPRYDRWVTRKKRTGAQPNINAQEYGNILIPYPPLPEQRKIATLLYTVDRTIQKTEQIIDKYQSIISGIIQDIATTGIDNKKLHEQKVPMLPEKWEIPTHWKLNFLENITTLVTDGAHQTPTYVEDGIPFLKVENIKQEEIDWDSVARIPEEEHKELIKSGNPSNGDVLLSKNGTIGITKVVDWEREFSHFVSLALIRPNQEIILPNYLSTLLESQICMRQAKARSKTGTVTNLHLEEIEKLSIPVPPIPEQRKILEKISVVEQCLNSEIRYRSQLKRLKKGLMQDLLSGTVRTTDTNIQVPDEIAQYG